VRVELAVGARDDFDAITTHPEYVDVGDPDFASQLAPGAGDHARFRATFGTAPGSSHPPSIDTIVIPYVKSRR